MIQLKLKINFFTFYLYFCKIFLVSGGFWLGILGIFTKYLGFLVGILGHKENTFLTSESWNKLLFYSNLGSSSSVWFEIFLLIFLVILK